MLFSKEAAPSSCCKQASKQPQMQQEYNSLTFPVTHSVTQRTLSKITAHPNSLRSLQCVQHVHTADQTASSSISLQRRLIKYKYFSDNSFAASI